MMRRTLVFGFVSLVILAAACAIPDSAAAQSRTFWGGVEGTFERTLNVSGTLDLDVSTGSGSIDIRRGSSNRVEIRGRIRASDGWWFRSSNSAEDNVRWLEANPPIEQSGQIVRIGKSPDRDRMQNVSISYEIYVPAQANIRANSGSGRLALDGIEGRVETITGSGSITLEDIRGEVTARTGSGSINARDIRGGLRMNTGSGGIRVQGEQTGRWDLQTGSGGIEINLPPSASFDLNAHTGSGGINVDYPVTVQGLISKDRHNMVGKVGSGGPSLNARTGSGGIRIQ